MFSTYKVSQRAIVNYKKKIEFCGAYCYNICKFFNFILKAYDFWTFWILTNLVIYLYYFVPIEIGS
jgi:hypothetical protein